MSDTDTAPVLRLLRERERSLELDAVAVRARIEEIREAIAILESGHRRRGARPRKVTVINMPGRIPGSIHEPEDAA